MARRPALRALARRLGVLDAYRPMAGAPPRATRDATRVALLAAMGFDASSEAAARQVGEELDAREREAWLAPVRVHVLGAAGRETLPLGATSHAPRGDWRLELCEESGRQTVREGRGGLRGLRLPRRPEPGYHTLRVRVEGGSGVQEREQRLVVAPPCCWRVDEALGRRPVHGVVANLYSLRGRRDWGVGDLGVVRSLVEEASRIGADFVGLSPLHATRARGDDVSPYSPVSRLHRSEIHLAVEAVPEWAAWRAACPAARGAQLEARRRALREGSRVDYDAAQALKREVLRELHGLFAERHGAGRTRRGAEYARFRAARPDLEAFASFQALAEHFVRRGAGHDWRRWPAAYRRPDSPEVRRFRARHGSDCDFHAWVQFELERQLAAAARAAQRRGQRIGLYQDLAVAAAPSGYECWAAPGLHAEANVGAPPDDFSADGQDWGLPATLPHVRCQRGHADWVDLLRAGFAHAGALRIDHAMGLVRQWWIPAGGSAREGGYVAYPSRDLFAILALESRRHRALVVGEDLGTVPRGFRATLARWGILSTRVLLFERGRRSFHPAPRYSQRALVTTTTHDLPPLAGYLVGRDLELRHAAGALDAGALAADRRERAQEVRALRRRLGVAGDAAPAEVTRAALRFLAGTASPLVGAALDDLVGETEPVNLPGLTQREHPSWTRRMAGEVESLRSQPAFSSCAPALRRTRLRKGASGERST